MNFKIQPFGAVSNKFIALNCTDFQSACAFVAKLSYKRNLQKEDILCVFNDFGGTCSTKHAVLRKLAIEHNQLDVKLMLGIFKMDAIYSPKIQATLEKHQLAYIPEAHNYLKIETEYFDFTTPNANYESFESKILVEQEIEYDEITTEKVAIHKAFLEGWLITEKIDYSLSDIWQIREKCIADLQGI
jgi:hypothetical protein